MHDANSLRELEAELKPCLDEIAAGGGNCGAVLYAAIDVIDAQGLATDLSNFLTQFSPCELGPVVARLVDSCDVIIAACFKCRAWMAEIDVQLVAATFHKSFQPYSATSEERAIAGVRAFIDVTSRTFTEWHQARMGELPTETLEWLKAEFAQWAEIKVAQMKREFKQRKFAYKLALYDRLSNARVCNVASNGGKPGQSYSQATKSCRYSEMATTKVQAHARIDAFLDARAKDIELNARQVKDGKKGAQERARQKYSRQAIQETLAINNPAHISDHPKFWQLAVDLKLPKWQSSQDKLNAARGVSTSHRLTSTAIRTKRIGLDIAIESQAEALGDPVVAAAMRNELESSVRQYLGSEADMIIEQLQNGTRKECDVEELILHVREQLSDMSHDIA